MKEKGKEETGRYTAFSRKDNISPNERHILVAMTLKKKAYFSFSLI